jgi:uroporphyrinogen-III synthase
VEAYRTVTAGEAEGVTPELLDRAERADVVLFASPSAVTAFLAVMGGRRVPPVVGCIGPVTAEAATKAGLTIDVVADRHDATGLVEALVVYMADRVGSPMTGA